MRACVHMSATDITFAIIMHSHKMYTLALTLVEMACTTVYSNRLLTLISLNIPFNLHVDEFFFFSFVAPVDIGHWNWNWNENKMNFQRFNRTTAQRTRYIILGHQMNSENNCVIGRNVEVGTVGVLLIASSNSTWSVCFLLKFLL